MMCRFWWKTRLSRGIHQTNAEAGSHILSATNKNWNMEKLKWGTSPVGTGSTRLFYEQSFSKKRGSILSKKFGPIPKLTLGTLKGYSYFQVGLCLFSLVSFQLIQACISHCQLFWLIVRPTCFKAIPAFFNHSLSNAHISWFVFI